MPRGFGRGCSTYDNAPLILADCQSAVPFSRRKGVASLRWFCLLSTLLACMFAPKMLGAEILLVDHAQARARIITSEHPTPVEQFAASELQRYLQAVTGARVPIVTETSPEDANNCAILLGCPSTHARLNRLCQELHLAADKAALGSDGYLLNTSSKAGTPQTILLAAAEERGVLFAVYYFLETLGIRFYGYRDRDGEIVPRRETLSLPALELTEKPAFRYRFVSDNGFSAADKTKFLNIADWGAKNRCNVYMLTPSHAGEKWEDFALDEVRRRGLMIAGPGHILSRFTPDKNLFSAHPEYFPLLKGKRTANYSEAWGGVPAFCWSNEKAMQLVVSNAMRYLAAAPFIDIFALYPPDGPQKSAQCQCAACAKMSMSDWYLTLMNHVARECAGQRPNTKVMWISYNECGVPPPHVQPWNHGKNMVLFWCNDIRDFRAPMDSEINRHAASYLPLKPRLISVKTDEKKNPTDLDLAPWHRWQSWSAYLRRTGFAGDVILLDYYNAHVGKSLHVPMLQHCQSGPWPDGLMQKDFQFYQAQGITGWQNCTDYYNDAPHPYWNRLSAQLLWNPRADVSALDADFYAQLYGPAGETMRRYYAALWHELALDASPSSRAQALETLGKQLAQADALGGADPAIAKRLKAAREFHAHLLK